MRTSDKPGITLNNDPEMNHDMKELEKDTDTLCEIRLSTSKINTTDEWTLDDLKNALKQLQT